MVPVDVKEILEEEEELSSCVKFEVAVLGSPYVPNSPYGLCGHKETLEEEEKAHELCDIRSGRPGLPRPLIVLIVSVDVKQR